MRKLCYKVRQVVITNYGRFILQIMSLQIMTGLLQIKIKCITHHGSSNIKFKRRKDRNLNLNVGKIFQIMSRTFYSLRFRNK